MKVMKIKKRKFRLILILVLVIVCSGIAFLLNETKDEVNATFATIEDDLNSVYNPNRMAGFSVSVFSADTIYYMKGMGQADVANKKDYTITTQQYIASVSKTLIGISLLKAQELGYVKLDNPINDYLPFAISNPSFKNKPITLRHLATHTSSLNYNEKVVESLYVQDSLKSPSLHKIMTDYFEKEVFGEVMYTPHAPGEHFNYSNIGASLAAYIIELKTGLTFDRFSQQYIFDALNLKRSSWFEKSLDSTQVSKYYESHDNGLTEVKTSGVKMYPSRDLITNISDLTKLCQAVMKEDPRLLSKESFQELKKEQLSPSVKNDAVDNSGLFFMIDRNQFGVTYSLTGMNGGDNCINTMMWFDPVTELGYIVICNTGASAKNRVNNIWLFRTLVSLGDHIVFDYQKNSFAKRLKYKAHNWYSRISAAF